MKKSILNLAGAQELSKNEQKEVNGGAKVFCGYVICLGEPNPVFGCGSQTFICANYK